VVAGLDVCAVGVALGLAAVLSGRLVGRIGERGPLVAGLAIGGAATLALLGLGPDSDLGAAWLALALVGAGVGLSGTPASAIAMSAVEPSRAGMASAVVNAMRQVGQVFGVAVLGALVYGQLPAARGGGRLDPAKDAQFVAGLHPALLVSGLALLVAAALAALLLQRSATRTQELAR
jgi:MFS family permease